MAVATPIEPAPAVNGAAKALQAATPLRDVALQAWSDLHQAQQSALAVESSRVAARYGAASPQARAIAARVASQTVRAAAIAAESRRAQIKTPDVRAGEFVVYGRVLDAAGAPQKDVAIVAARVPAAQPPTLGSASSLADGSFNLGLPVAGGVATESFQLVLTTADKSQAYTYPEDFTLVDGAVAYREITLPA